MGAINWIDVLVALAVGLRVGMWIEARRWRRNAKNYLRIESGGKLYKVEEDR